EEYVPPKEEIAPVEEKDAVYTKRCKLFQKKRQADTRLGNILLNIMLAQSLPVSRLGKNNVGLPKDADELKDALERYKGEKDS
ncbi:hypothetical protein MRX96_052855, partial [Rhipicephalus microplus]